MKHKFLKSTLSLIIAFAAMSFTNGDADKKVVNVEKSKVTWKGYKVTGEHEGTIALKEGFLTYEGTKLTGGEFVIDMTTISSTDLEGEWKEKLDGHLKADDFFGVANHPTAKLVITKVEPGNNGAYMITGDFTIKGVTVPSSFELSADDNSATASIKLDRTKYGLKYGSGSFFDNLGDKAINDDFDVNVNLQF
jgi:polyisoprenoid-binding protein YceI